MTACVICLFSLSVTKIIRRHLNRGERRPTLGVQAHTDGTPAWARPTRALHTWRHRFQHASSNGSDGAPPPGTQTRRSLTALRRERREVRVRDYSGRAATSRARAAASPRLASCPADERQHGERIEWRIRRITCAARAENARSDERRAVAQPHEKHAGERWARARARSGVATDCSS